MEPKLGLRIFKLIKLVIEIISDFRKAGFAHMQHQLKLQLHSTSIFNAVKF